MRLLRVSPSLISPLKQRAASPARGRHLRGSRALVLPLWRWFRCAACSLCRISDCLSRGLELGLLRRPAHRRRTRHLFSQRSRRRGHRRACCAIVSGPQGALATLRAAQTAVPPSCHCLLRSSLPSLTPSPSVPRPTSPRSSPSEKRITMPRCSRSCAPETDLYRRSCLSMGTGGGIPVRQGALSRWASRRVCLRSGWVSEPSVVASQHCAQIAALRSERVPPATSCVRLGSRSRLLDVRGPCSFTCP